MGPVKSLCKHFFLAAYAFFLSLVLFITFPFWIVPYYLQYDKLHPLEIGQPRREPLLPLLQAMGAGLYSILFSGFLLLLSPLWVLPYAIMQDRRNQNEL